MLRTSTLLLLFLFSGNLIVGQCLPQLLNCGPLANYFCDTSLNAPQYWNDASWWDGIYQLHDLPETPVNLSFTIRDTCPTNNLSVRCLLFLDLDRDGIQETVVNTDSLPDAGMVNFGNIGGPGIPRPFDKRLVPDEQKWLFALEHVQSGDTLSTRLRWNTAMNPADFSLPELPYGVHKVRWELSDSSGIIASCEYDFTVKDCKAPTIVCLNNLTVNILSAHQIQLWATDFLAYTEDNVTLAPYIRLGIRKAGTGTGFPVTALGDPISSLIFDCTELGSQDLELWAVDLAGNADYCGATVTVADNSGNCDNWGGIIDACTRVACYDDIVDPYDMVYELSYVDSGQIIMEYVTDNCTLIGQNTPLNQDIIIAPNGNQLSNDLVHTYDLVIITRHILQADTFNTAFQWVSADANQDGVIDNKDIVVCRDHILGIKPLEPAWRFVDKNYVFPWPGNPLATPFPESITVHPVDSLPIEVEFYAIPICDVSCGNVVGFFDLEPENQHLIGIPQPNPSYGGAQLPLQLLREESVFFELMDASGKQTFKQALMLPAGAALFEIPAYAMPVAGLYFWRIRVGELVEGGRISRI